MSFPVFSRFLQSVSILSKAFVIMGLSLLILKFDKRKEFFFLGVFLTPFSIAKGIALRTLLQWQNKVLAILLPSSILALDLIVFPWKLNVLAMNSVKIFRATSSSMFFITGA